MSGIASTTCTAEPHHELAGLLVAARLWAARQPLDHGHVRHVLEAALLRRHEQHVALVPGYRQLALELGHEHVGDLDVLARDMLVGAAYFKSYADSLLPQGDFAGLTAWVRQISALDCRPELVGVRDLEGWRRALRGVGVYVGLSSGTGGRPSLVPRDRATLSALSGNSRFYSTLGSWGSDGPAGGDHDCLLLTAPGRRSGIESVAAGLAAAARRTLVVAPATGPEGEPASLARVETFVKETRLDARRLLLFGTPPAVAWFTGALRRRGASLPVPDGSLLVTGGGWKGRDGPTLDELGTDVAATLDLGPEALVDVYGMAECNTYLFRCARGRYHVPPLLHAVVVDDMLVPLDSARATGQVGLLDPFARSYPGFLLTGDRATLVQTDCGCGLEGPGFVGAIERQPRHEAKGCAGAPVGASA